MADNDYEVFDRDDVKRKLEDFGVDSVGDIRRSHGSYHHKLREAQDAEQLNLHAAGSPGQIAANLEALARAKVILGQQADTVNALIAEAAHFATPMSDGHGPIAKAMRTAFHERADDTKGAVRVLVEYRDKLNQVLTAVDRTLNSYDQTEFTATRRLSASGADNA